MATGQLVLVTGGSGFVGSYCIIALLQAGHRVRTTVRSLKREADVRAMVKAGGVEAGDNLSLVEADLMSDAGWAQAAAGCEYVLHVASPLPAQGGFTEDEVVKPAVEGTLRALRAARDAGVKRVVLTSSFAAIGYGHPSTSKPFTEEIWGDLNGPDMHGYPKSKLLAERAAWDFVAAEGRGMELATIQPTAVFGPALSGDYASSLQIVSKLLDGSMPGAPRIYFGVSDVRDVADLHVRAMTHPKAVGERFLSVAPGGSMSMKDVGTVLRAKLGARAARVPTWTIPDWLIWLGSFVSPTMATLYPLLGKVRHSTGEKATRMLGWQPRPREETIVETAESLLRLGLIKGQQAQTS